MRDTPRTDALNPECTWQEVADLARTLECELIAATSTLEQANEWIAEAKLVIERAAKERDRLERELAEMTGQRDGALADSLTAKDGIIHDRDDWHKLADDRAAEIVRLKYELLLMTEGRRVDNLERLEQRAAKRKERALWRADAEALAEIVRKKSIAHGGKDAGGRYWSLEDAEDARAAVLAAHEALEKETHHDA